ncbi:hypothetical protein [Laspinema olomoucense]|uniref:Uncharacterized protein n=1 Tax=Laspinema olomoucense D3b TaxID=2953688 RepID=A0ABT2N7Y4_9CYAN|nr:hypothetical protein [Laspinema sp. D3b]MCT7977954.1 hypothetical protein [Laspinema sp. D3b]
MLRFLKSGEVIARDLSQRSVSLWMTCVDVATKSSRLAMPEAVRNSLETASLSLR